MTVIRNSSAEGNDGLALAPIVDAQGRAESRRFARNRVLTIVLFLLPGFVMLGLFLVMPIGQAVWYSLFKWNGLGPLTEFTGADNYVRALTNSVFHKSLRHTGILIVLSLVLQLPLAMALAITLVRGELRGAGFFRAVFFIPYVFSEVMTGIIWIYVYNPGGGLLNAFLAIFNPEAFGMAWLADQRTVLIAIFVVLTWKYFGFHMLLYMAGLQNVSRDVEDAARTSGASEAQVLRYITLPMMGSTIRLTVFLSILGAMQQFILIWVLTTGGPANASEVIVTFLYKYGIQRMQLGFGSAVAVILLLLTLIFSVGYQRSFMQDDVLD